ncbi:MAG: tetratricopeptide repeat protein [Nitrospirae bacterium]|nr:tetratricopeptide repeat protein [Nitrospirota bacterium]
MKRYGEAEKALKKALENPLYKSPHKAFTNLGRVYYRVGKFAEAERAYKSALKRVPDFFMAYYGLALTYNAMGRYGDAAEALTEAIKMDPAFKGDFEKAKEYFMKIQLKTIDRDTIQDYNDLLEILHY